MARTLLERAVACSSNSAPACSHLASLGMRWIAQGWSDDEEADREMAYRAARTAVERDPSDAVGLAISGHLQAYMFRNFAAAQECFKLAIATNPSCAAAWAYSALTLGYLGDTEQAIAHAEQALRLSPRRHRQLLARALPVAMLLPRGPLWGRDRLGQRVGRQGAAQRLEPALPRRQPGRDRRTGGRGGRRAAAPRRPARLPHRRLPTSDAVERPSARPVRRSAPDRRTARLTSRRRRAPCSPVSTATTVITATTATTETPAMHRPVPPDGSCPTGSRCPSSSRPRPNRPAMRRPHPARRSGRCPSSRSPSSRTVPGRATGTPGNA